MAAAAFSFLVTDHLGTPRVAVDHGGQLSWKGLSEAFGETRVIVGVGAAMNLRLPGQYFDVESGLHYNNFRDFKPRTGRYIEAGPLGAKIGPHQYRYANANPLSEVDPLGLFEVGPDERK